VNMVLDLEICKNDFSSESLMDSQEASWCSAWIAFLDMK
jgi:hypothetical protein